MNFEAIKKSDELYNLRIKYCYANHITDRGMVEELGK